MSQGPRVFISKATCAAPFCEVLTPCRGPRPHHVQKERIGSWEISGLTGRAVTALLNAIGFSYGFRPGRGAHDAMDALCVGIHSKKVSFILDARVD